MGWSVKSQAEVCKNFVAIVPALTQDPQLTRWLTDEVSPKIPRSSALPCAFVLTHEETSSAFDYIGLNAYFSMDPDALVERQIELLQERTEATHLGFLKKESESHRYRFDLFRFRGERADPN